MATARSVTTVPQPRRPLAAASLATPRQTTAEPVTSDATPKQGLDWARRIELVAVLIAALVSVAGLVYSNAQIGDQLRISRQELRITQEGQITDRYTAAVENLGDDATDVRLGGVYALQRIMQGSPRDHPTIGNVLATYIRTHADKPRKKSEALSADVLAALAVLAFRDSARDDYFTLDLRDTHLAGIDLSPRRSKELLIFS
jgi:hypothetical protein